jgi:hypothetical protein
MLHSKLHLGSAVKPRLFGQIRQIHIIHLYNRVRDAGSTLEAGQRRRAAIVCCGGLGKAPGGIDRYQNTTPGKSASVGIPKSTRGRLPGGLCWGSIPAGSFVARRRGRTASILGRHRQYPVHCAYPRSHRRCWPARPDLGERWPSRLVATSAEDRLNIRRNSRTSLLRQPAIAEQSPFRSNTPSHPAAASAAPALLGQ